MATKKAAPKRAKKKTSTGKGSAPRRFSPEAVAAIEKAANVIWKSKEPPHALLKELHDRLLLRCLEEAEGNYAAAAERFGPSRQSVQQYANSSLRDARWKAFQHDGRAKR